MYLRPVRWPTIKAGRSIASGLLLGIVAVAAVAGQLSGQQHQPQNAHRGKCEAYSGLPDARDGLPDGMLRIPGGEFLMGSDLPLQNSSSLK